MSNPKYFLIHHYGTIPKPPKIIQSAVKHPGWKKAIEEELEAL